MADRGNSTRSEDGCIYLAAAFSSHCDRRMEHCDMRPINDCSTQSTAPTQRFRPLARGPVSDSGTVDDTSLSHAYLQAIEPQQSSDNGASDGWNEIMRHRANGHRPSMPDFGFNWSETKQEYCSQEETARENNGHCVDDICAPNYRGGSARVVQPMDDQMQPWMPPMSTVISRHSSGYNNRPNCENAHSYPNNMGIIQHTQPLAPTQNVRTLDPTTFSTKSPWSGFNLRENTANLVPASKTECMTKRKIISETSRSEDAGNVFSRLDENGMNSISSFCWDVNDTTDTDKQDQGTMIVCSEGTNQGAQWSGPSRYSYSQEHNGYSQSTNIPVIMRGDVPLLDDDGECSTPPDGAFPCLNNRKCSATSPMNPNSDPGSTVSALSPSTADTTRCSEPGCDAVFRGGYRKGSLGRHRRLKHRQGGATKYPCADQDCLCVFERQDARLKHHRRQHPHLGTPEAMRRSSRVPQDVFRSRSSLTPLKQEEQLEGQEQVLRNVSSWT